LRVVILERKGKKIGFHLVLKKPELNQKRMVSDPLKVQNEAGRFLSTELKTKASKVLIQIR